MVTETVQIAQVEARSWGAHPTSYTINYSGTVDISFEVDIIRPWDCREKSYHLYLVSDDLCLSKLPFYIPMHQRIALLKESHLLPRIYEPSNVPKLLSRFSLIITHHDRIAASDKKCALVPYSSNMVDLCPYETPCCLPAVSKKSNLCSAVINLGAGSLNSSARVLRKEVIEYLSTNQMVNLFGKSMNPIERKADALVTYAFSVAMENIVSPSYFTEKLIDCILTGTIPIYHGSRSVLNYFDGRGIIFFDSLDELKQILSNLSQADYLTLRRYAEKNFEIALRLRLADYHGYLHRICDVIASTVNLSNLMPFRISQSFASKLKATASYGFSSLGI